MAVPFLIQEDAEDCYRSLDFLLEQLLITLRQVMTLRRREAVSNAHNTIRQHRQVSAETVTAENRTSELILDTAVTTTITPTTSHNNERTVESTRDLVHSIRLLPDVVLDTTSASQEQKEMERTAIIERTESTAQTQDWVQVGADLKRIADQLVATNRLDQMNEREGEKEKISLLSQFCPHLGSSVWTTVAILVGWGLLSRTR